MKVSILDFYFPNINTRGRPDKSSILYTDKKSFLFFINQFKHSTLYFNIGNNHLHDYGDLGIKKTIEFFDKLKINYFGVISKNLDKSSIIIYYKNLRIKLTSVSTDSIDVMSVISKKEKFYIKDYKKPSFDYQTSNQFDLEIILPHWGKEYINFPRKEIIDYSKEWLNLGVDYIIGNHPHVIQASLNDKVFFGLGNFYFKSFKKRNKIWHTWSSDSRKSIIVEIDPVLKHTNVLGIEYFKNKINPSNKAMLIFHDVNKKFLQNIHDDKKYYLFFENEYYKLLKKEKNRFYFGLKLVKIILIKIYEKLTGKDFYKY